MGLTLLASGTQTAVIGTEHILYSTTSLGIFVTVVDLKNLGASDTVQLYIKTKVLSTSTSDGAYFQSFSGIQSTTSNVLFSVPVPSDQYFAFCLKQTATTGQNFDWKVFSL